MTKADHLSLFEFQLKIVAIGDSITYGFPYTSALSWLTIAAERLHIAYVNSGVNGDTTDGMVARFQRDVLSHQPTHVVIMGGTNDAYLGSEVDHVANNIRYMSELALENSITPIIGVPIPCNDLAEGQLLGEYRNEMRNYAASRGIALIDFFAAIVDESGAAIKEGLHCDDVHLNEAGYKVMAGVAADMFSKLISK